MSTELADPVEEQSDMQISIQLTCPAQAAIWRGVLESLSRTFTSWPAVSALVRSARFPSLAALCRSPIAGSRRLQDCQRPVLMCGRPDEFLVLDLQPAVVAPDYQALDGLL